MGRVFVSYARNDLQGGELQRFLDDLEHELEKQLGTTERILFQDRPDIRPGAEWEQTLREALATCGVFLCLYSPSCLNSVHCGKEFGLFLHRLERRKQEAPRSRLGPVLVPIKWRKLLLQELPPMVGRYQDDHISFPELYKREGVCYLGQLKKFEDEYLELVRRLAEFLCVALQEPLPQLPILPPFDIIPNVFEMKEEAAGALAAAAAHDGPNSVQFVLVAGARDELREIRTFIDYYGIDGWSWRPYLPRQEDEIGAIVQSLSGQLRMRCGFFATDPNLCDNIAAAERKNQVVVILADPWTLRFPQYAQAFKQYDGENRLNTAVVIVWNPQDEETVFNRPDLEKMLKQIFWRKYRRPPCAHLWHGVEDAASLDISLRRVIQEVRLQIFEEGEVQRPVESEALEAEALSRGVDATAQAVVQGPVGVSS